MNLDAGGAPGVCDDVIAAMLPWLGEAGAREDGLHASSRAARRALDDAREALGALAGAAPDRVVFTSGAPESLAQVLRAATSQARGGLRTIACPAHDATAIAAAVRTVARERGVAVRALAVDLAGLVQLGPEDGAPGAIALSWAHPVLGTIQDVPKLARRLARDSGVLAVDATWILGRLPLGLSKLPADVAVFADLAPLGVPHGIGVSYLPESLDAAPLLPGVEQDGRRAGAVPVALAAGAGVAARRLARGLEARAAALRDAAGRLVSALSAVAGVSFPGPSPEARAPGHVAVAAAGLRADALVLALSERGVLASAGSACGEAGLPASSLVAAGLPEPIARGTIVLAMPAGTPMNVQDLARAAAAFDAAVASLRGVAGPRR